MSNEIEELKKEDLLIAQDISLALCTMQYNVNVRFFTGEELDSYAKLWGKKLKDVGEQIEASESVSNVLDIRFKFCQELMVYVKAAKVDTAEKAMEIAHAFIKKYVPVALPLKAVKEKDVWLVDIDVGALSVKVAKVKVDARTGDVLSYDIPTKESKKAK